MICNIYSFISEAVQNPFGDNISFTDIDDNGMYLEEVLTCKQENDFLEMPRLIYKNDPHWIPHIRQDIQKIFESTRNKLFKKGEAIRWILKNREGVTIGRVAAFHTGKVAQPGKLLTGGFGFFECIDDDEAARILLDQCARWNKQHGMQAMDGPINFGEKDQYWGLMISNFDNPGTYGMNYNPAYYRRFFDNYGFGTYYEQYVNYRPVYLPVQEVYVRKAESLKGQGYSVRCIDPTNTDKFAEDFRTIYNDAWRVHDNFKPMEKEQAQNIMRMLKPIMDPDIIYFAYYNNEPVGFYINCPELNTLFKYVDGNLNWWGKVKFMYHKLKGDCRTMFVIVFGVVKAHQGKGVEGLMIKYCQDHLYPLNRYDHVILTWVGDFNAKSLKMIENLEGKLWRTYITCRVMLDKNIPFERFPMIAYEPIKELAKEQYSKLEPAYNNRETYFRVNNTMETIWHYLAIQFSNSK